MKSLKDGKVVPTPYGYAVCGRELEAGRADRSWVEQREARPKPRRQVWTAGTQRFLKKESSGRLSLSEGAVS
jgi:hypothetical protein